MSLPEEPSDINDQKKTEHQEDDELNPEEPSSKNAQKDFLKPSQTEKRAISPLTLLKDFNQFKEEVKKKFKDKDANPRTNQSTVKLVRPLTHLKEDFEHFKEDISSVFRIGLLKDRGNKDETVRNDPPNNSKTSKTERANEPFRNLFRRDRTQNVKDTNEVKKSNEQTNLGAHNENSNSIKSSMNKSNNKVMDVNGSEKTTEKSFTETQQSEMMFASRTAVQKYKTDRSDVSVLSKREKEPSGSSPLETTHCGINLFSLSLRDKPIDDQWSPKNFATYLTLDPNTANAELRLADGNRTVIRDWLTPRPSQHPDRFNRCPQVLCREGLLDLIYWEVVWTGGADIGVTYNSISRYGDTTSCILGHNEQSWSLECSEGSYTPCHNNKRFKSSSPEPFTHRVGVYLNWPAGTLSFYCISQDAMVHLHTFTSTFTEPLYPGFWVWAADGSVALCQVELDWERLLQ